jgi:cytochrome c-type protein NapB
MRLLRTALIACAAAAVTAAAWAETVSDLRGPVPLDTEGPPPAVAKPVDPPVRPVRGYPEQPPVIPHPIEGFTIDLTANVCLACHARAQTGDSKAPMVSITHFTDRDGQVLATVAPRRYVCTECHVPQFEVSPPVKNDFADIDTVLSKAKPDAPKP